MRQLARPRWRLAVGLVFVLLTCGSISTADDENRGPRSDAAPQEKRPPVPPKYHLGPGAGKARTSLFGVVGEGYKFVYVFDRSGSMGGSGRNALRAVKAELLASLENLDTIHQFQIIFYNDKPVAFNPSGVQGRLAFANDQNKRRARRFIETIVADGGTRHMDALELASKMQPDVIFFLTDADEPKLSRRDLDKIQRQAAGITIHAIEFGSGPKPEGKSFLAVLAEENAGQYTYVDISKPSPASDEAN